ncbi:hypothetical protein PSDVSF_11950 [Pseudodesulfovibrio sediminis]|uniref:Uncharacterized protein n=1 Tax=Pseudodesulfovibrio sediminis TaxID=2810563 RepID=A0ABN6ENT8_9BACT|nr:hypothetical protein PSDVSF_11950 [Pseudodesulfovibrio sediminis]
MLLSPLCNGIEKVAQRKNLLLESVVLTFSITTCYGVSLSGRYDVASNGLYVAL